MMRVHRPDRVQGAMKFLGQVGWVMLLAALFQPGCNHKCPPNEQVHDRACSCPASDRCVQVFCDQVYIPAGPFVMGSDHEPSGRPPDYFRGLPLFGDPGPAHEVYLESFCMDKYEVTLERYEACVQAGACSPGEAEHSYLAEGPAFKTRVNHYPDDCVNHGELCPVCPVKGRSC